MPCDQESRINNQINAPTRGQLESKQPKKSKVNAEKISSLDGRVVNSTLRQAEKQSTKK